KRLLDRLLGHRAEPEALDRLVDARGLVRVGEDQLALAPGVAGVDDAVDVLTPHELVHGRELLLGGLVARDRLELVRQDRRRGAAGAGAGRRGGAPAGYFAAGRPPSRRPASWSACPPSCPSGAPRSRTCPPQRCCPSWSGRSRSCRSFSSSWRGRSRCASRSG